jgi:hypothetical protein
MEEKKHLTGIVPYAFNNTEATYPVRQDNAVLYKSNIYTVPEGTYNGRGTEVFITATDIEVVIKDIYGNHLCTHALCTGKGRIIANTNHKRDRSKTIDNMLLEVAMAFPDYDNALLYLEQIRKEKRRYARDQFLAIRKAVEKASPESVLKALAYCMKNKIYSASDFEAVVDKHLRDNPGSRKITLPAKRTAHSINKKIHEIVPQTSNIIDYDKIMKN